MSSVPSAPAASSSTTSNSARAKALLQAELEAPPSAIVVVYHSDTLTAGSPEFEAAAAAAIRDVPNAPYVVRVFSHTFAPRQVSADGRTAYDVVFLSIAPDDSPAALPGIVARLAQPPGISVEVAGGPAFYGDVQHVSEADLQRSEIISLPLAAIALLFVFGSVVAAGVPLVVGGAAVIVALAAIFGIASVTPMSIFVLNLATLLGLGLGVDYSLLMTSRFREELAARPPDQPDRVANAVVATVATAGRAVFFSGLTVLLGLIGLVLFEFMILRSVGIAGAVVVFLAVVSAMTLLPAILAIVGTRIDALAIRRVVPVDDPNGPWARLARWVMRRPIAVLLPTLAILLLLGSPFLHVRFNAPDSTILPPSVPSRAAFDRLAGAFGEGEFAPLTLAIRTDGPATSADNLAALFDYSRRLAADARVTRVDSLVDIDPRIRLDQYQLIYSDPNGPRDRFVATALESTTKGDLTAFTVYTPFGPNREEGRALVADLRSAVGPLAPPAGMQLLVGGGAADVTDVVGRVAADFPRTAIFIVVTTYLVLFMLLRSVVLPAKALVMNTLSIVASFGALVWIFQDGNLSALLGFQPLGFVETTQPVILFCVLFGLSMDYEVFLLSRMKEVWDKTGDNQEAVARGLERSGRIVTSAALIVVVVAGSFAFADIVLIKALGIGMALAVALDATVVRALLVPATMRLLGRWNWWVPGRLRRLPVIGTALLVLATPLLAACAAGPILANPPAPRPTTAAAAPLPSHPADPIAVELPRDDAPHDRLTEWWYYTGHLKGDDGSRYGFEFVVFRVERGGFPVAWASHLAVTDEGGDAFHSAQRFEFGPQVDLDAADLPVFTLPHRRRCRCELGDVRQRRPRHADGHGDAPGSGSGRLAGRAGVRPGTRRDEAAGTPRRRRLGRLRGRRVVVLLLTDRDGCDGQPHPGRRNIRRDRNRLVRPPVGRLHRRGRWRLGLVRDEPRRRDRHHAVAQPGHRRVVLDRLRDARGRRGPITQPAARVLRHRGHRSLAEPEDRRELPRRLASHDPGRGSRDHADADRRGPGARHAGDDEHLLGGITARGGPPRRQAGRRRGVCRTDRLRVGRCRGAVGSGRRGERDAGAAGDVAKLGVHRIQTGKHPGHLLGGGLVGRVVPNRRRESLGRRLLDREIEGPEVGAQRRAARPCADHRRELETDDGVGRQRAEDLRDRERLERLLGECGREDGR